MILITVNSFAYRDPLGLDEEKYRDPLIRIEKDTEGAGKRLREIKSVIPHDLTLKRGCCSNSSNLRLTHSTSSSTSSPYAQRRDSYRLRGVVVRIMPHSQRGYWRFDTAEDLPLTQRPPDGTPTTEQAGLT